MVAFGETADFNDEFVLFLQALAIAIAMSLYGISRKSLSTSGSVAGLFVGSFTWWSNVKFGMLMLSFFVTSSRITKWNGERKRKLESDHKEGGQRDWKQVLANSLVATVLGCIHWWLFGHDAFPLTSSGETELGVPRVWSTVLQAAIVGHYACCAGDTWASETGITASQARLITSCRRVPPGTNGGVSLRGTVFSALGGLTMGITYWLTPCAARPEGLSAETSSAWDVEIGLQWRVIVLGLVGGLCGSAIDSVLGSLCQYSGYDEAKHVVVNAPTSSSKPLTRTICTLLSNDAVNMLAAALTSALLASVTLLVF